MKLDPRAIAALPAGEPGLVSAAEQMGECIGLPAGFLQPGASIVISSQWRVEAAAN